MDKRIMHMSRLLLLVVALAGCDNDKSELVPSAPGSYQARAAVGDLTISVVIAQAHPTLAEHEKRIEVLQGTKQVAQFKLNDPGGFATVYVVDEGSQLLVIDGLLNGKAIDKKSGNAVDVEPKSVPSDFAERNLGRFELIDTPTAYGWVANPS